MIPTNYFNHAQQYPSAFEKAQKFCENAQINFPYMSEGDKLKLGTVKDDEIYGTYPIVSDRNLYDINSCVKEALSTPRDYILFGIAGHGINSRALHYYAVKDHVAIFVQMQLGVMDENGILENQDEAHNKINAVFHGISRIFEKIEKAESQNLIPDGQRLLIVKSDFYGSGWEWITGTPGKIDEAAWNDKGMTLLAALRAIPAVSKS